MGSTTYFRNAIFNLGSSLLPALSWLIAIPLIIKAIGVDSYGILALLVALTGYMTFLDLGFNVAVTKFVAEYHSRGERRKLERIVQTSLGVTLALGALAFLTILSTSGWMASTLFKIPAELQEHSYKALQVAGAVGAMGLLSVTVSSIINGRHGYHYTGSITIVVVSGTVLGFVLVFNAGHYLREAMLLSLSLVLAGFMVSLIVLRRLYPGLSLRPKLHKDALLTLARFGIFSIFYRASATATFQLDRIVVGVVLGSAMVGYYVVPFQVAVMITRATSSVGRILLPVFSELSSSGSLEELQSVFIRAVRLVNIFTSLLTFPLLGLMAPLLLIWVGDEFLMNSHTVAIVLVCANYLSAATVVPSVALDGVGRPKINAAFALLTTVITVASIVPLTASFGTAGTAAAIALGVAHAPLDIFIVSRYYLNMRLSGVWTAYARPFFAGVICYIITIKFLQPLVVDLPSLVSAGTVSGALYLALAWVFGSFTREDLAFIANDIRFSRVLRPRGSPPRVQI